MHFLTIIMSFQFQIIRGVVLSGVKHCQGTTGVTGAIFTDFHIEQSCLAHSQSVFPGYKCNGKKYATLTGPAQRMLEW